MQYAYIFSGALSGVGMEEHLQLVGIVGLVACVCLGIVVVALCIVLCCQRCRHRDIARAALVDSENQTGIDNPPDYAWCAENAGYNPDNLPESESSSQEGTTNDEVPPPYDSVAIAPSDNTCLILDPNQLPHVYSSSKGQPSSFLSALPS